MYLRMVNTMGNTKKIVGLIFVFLFAIMALGNLAVNYRIIAGEYSTGLYYPLKQDSVTNALCTVDYPHHEIHSGSHFSIENFTTLGSGASMTFGITTPNTGKWGHMTFSVEGSLKTTVYCYKIASFTDGTPVVAFNDNHNSTTESVMSVVSQPTVASTGILFSAYTAGSGTNGASAEPGAGSREHEFILKQNSQYLFRVVSGAAANDVSWQAKWYEHTNKH